MTTPSILVIDDDRDVRESVVDVLENAGYRVLAASHGEEAISLLRSRVEPPALILLDILMPVMDGWAFRSAQRTLPREVAVIPVVITTAYGVPEERTGELDAAALLRKPFDLNALLETVQSIAGPPR